MNRITGGLMGIAALMFAACDVNVPASDLADRTDGDAGDGFQWCFCQPQTQADGDPPASDGDGTIGDGDRPVDGDSPTVVDDRIIPHWVLRDRNGEVVEAAIDTDSFKGSAFEPDELNDWGTLLSLGGKSIRCFRDLFFGWYDLE